MVPKADNNRRFACVNGIARPAWPVNGAGHRTQHTQMACHVAFYSSCHVAASSVH